MSSLSTLHNLITASFTDPTKYTQCLKYISETPDSLHLLLQYISSHCTRAIEIPADALYDRTNIIVFSLILIKRFIESQTHAYLQKDTPQRQQILAFCLSFLSSQNEWHKVHRVVKYVSNLMIIWVKYMDPESAAHASRESSSNALQASTQQEKTLQDIITSLMQNECPTTVFLLFLSEVVESFILVNAQPVMHTTLGIIRKFQTRLNEQEARDTMVRCLRVLRELVTQATSVSDEVLQLAAALMGSPLTNELQIEGYKLFDAMVTHHSSLIEKQLSAHVQSVLNSLLREAQRFEQNCVCEQHDTDVYNTYGEAISTDIVSLELVNLLSSMLRRDCFNPIMEEASAGQIFEQIFFHVMRFVQFPIGSFEQFTNDTELFIEEEYLDDSLRTASVDLLKEFLEMFAADEEDTNYLVSNAFMRSIQKHLNECQQQASRKNNDLQREAAVCSMGKALPLLEESIQAQNEHMQFVEQLLQFMTHSLRSFLAQAPNKVTDIVVYLSARYIWFMCEAVLTFSDNLPHQYLETFWACALAMIRRTSNSSISLICIGSIASALSAHSQKQQQKQSFTSLAPPEALDAIITCAWKLLEEQDREMFSWASLLFEPFALLMRHYPAQAVPSIVHRDGRRIAKTLMTYMSLYSSDNNIAESILQIAEQSMIRGGAGQPILELALQQFENALHPQQDTRMTARFDAPMIELIDSMLLHCAPDSFVAPLVDQIVQKLVQFATQQHKDDERNLEACQEGIRILVHRFPQQIKPQTVQMVFHMIQSQLQRTLNVQSFCVGNLFWELVTQYFAQDQQMLNQLLSLLAEALNGLNVDSDHRLYVQSLVVLLSRVYLKFGSAIFQRIKMDTFVNVWLPSVYDLHPCAESYKQACVRALHRFTEEFRGQSILEMPVSHPQIQVRQDPRTQGMTFSLGVHMCLHQLLDIYLETLSESAGAPLENKYFSDWQARKSCIDEDDPRMFDDPVSGEAQSYEVFVNQYLNGLVNGGSKQDR